MPVHNAAPYVADAIRSVLAQTETNFELIVIDDASTDDSAAIVSAIRDPRIRFRRSATPLNAAGARNLALAEAAGEFVAFLDADDLAQPARFGRQIELLRARPEILVTGSLVGTINGQGTRLGRGFVDPLAPEEVAPTLLFQNCLALSSVMARRAALPPFRPEFAPAEDYDLWVRLPGESPFFIIPTELTNYRQHASGVSARQPEQMRTALAAIQSLLLGRLKIEPSPIHAQLVEWPLHPTMEQLLAAERWLNELAAANGRTGAYPEAPFRRVLARRWFRLCLDSWTLGWPVWRVFHRSPLARPTLSRSLRLFRRLAPQLLRR
jgi:glycosyltransferase involved in cell wall biosynthesis